MPKVLLVDDSAFDRQRAGRILEKRSAADGGSVVTVLYASDSTEAMAALRNESPDLVITDLQMPGMDGLDLIREIRNTRPTIPVIVMTASGSEETALEALRRGAASYVPKKSLAENLLDTVEGVLEATQVSRERERIIECLKKSESHFVLDNDHSLIPPLINHLKDNLARLTGADNSDLLRVTVALREAVLNAMHHGNLDMSSSLREEDESRYHALVEQRRKEKPYCDRRVSVTATETADEAIYFIRDQGKGFDPSKLPDPTDPANLERVSGRGLLLIRSFMAEVRHNDIGNEITMIWRKSSEPPE